MTTDIKQINIHDGHHAENHSVFNLTKLNFKYILNNSVTLIQLFVFAFCAVFCTVVFSPLRVSGSLLVVTGVLIPSLVVMGNIGYGMRNSSLYSNIRAAGFRKRDFYIPTLVTILFLQIFLSAVMWSSMWVLGKLGIIMVQWRERGYSVNILTFISIVSICYTIFIGTFVVFIFYFLTHNLVSSIKGYYIVVMVTFIIGVIFGGTLNNNFSHPMGYHDVNSGYTTYDNTWIAHSANGGQYFVTFTSIDDYNPEAIDNFYVGNPHGQMYGGGMFPKSIFLPTLLNPLYGVGQFASTSMGEVAFNFQYRTNLHVILPSGVDAEAVVDYLNNITNNDDAIADLIFNEYLNNETWMSSVNTLAFDPYPNGLQFKHLFGIGFGREHILWTLTLAQPYVTVVVYFLIGKSLVLLKEYM